MEQYVLLVVCVLLFVKAAGLPLPIPGDLLIVLVGVLIGDGAMQIGPALVGLTLATACGALALFGMVRRLGHERVQQYGRLIGLTPPRLAEVERNIRERGWWAIAVGRTVPGVRLATVVASALFQVPGRTFASAASAAALVEVVLCLALGILIGVPLRAAV